MCAASPTRVLHRDELFAVTDYRCAARRGERGGEEQVHGHEAVFVRAGLFRMRIGRDSFVATRNEMLLLAPGDVYRIEHPVAGGDRCTVLSLPPALEPATADGTKLRRTLADARSWALHFDVLRALNNGAEELAVQERIAALAHRVWLAGSPESRPAPRASARKVLEVQELLAAHSHRRLTLVTIARLAGLSPFHLSRSFKAATGLSVHRYLMRLRLREALHRLEEGEKDLSRMALEIGYSNHAHFTSAFGREFGVPPSAWRMRSVRPLREGI